MTLPNGPAGLATIGLEFAFSSGDSGVPGTLDSIPGAIDRTQSTITDILKGQMQDSSGWNAAHEAGYGEMTPGIPFVPNIIFQMADMLVDMTPLGAFFNLSDITSLFSAGTSFFGGLIPGLDASKITSGSFPMEMITGLLDTFDDIPLLGPFVEALTGSTGDLTDLASWANLVPLLSGGFLLPGIIPGLDASKIISGTFGDGLLQPFIDAVSAGFGGSGGLGLTGLTDFLSSLVFGGADWSELFSGITGQAGGLPDLVNLFTGGLFGNIDPGRISFVPTGAIGTDSPNLFINPGFDGAISMQELYGWTWDGTFGHTSVGSAKVIADGVEHTLFTNPVAVDVNQTIPMGIWVHYTGLTAAAASNALQFAVQAYAGTGAGASFVSETMLAGIASPSGASSNPAENNFIHLEGTYTVPAGVDEIRGVAKVKPAATAGTVHYDDAHAQTTRLLPIPFIDGLPTQLTDLTAFGQGIVDNLMNAWGAGGTGFDITDLFGLAQAIPGINILGLGGVNPITQNLQDLIDTGVQAIVGGLGTGYFLSDWKDALTAIPPFNVLGAAGMPDMNNTITTMWDNVTSALRLFGLSGVTLSDFAAAAQDTSTSATSAESLSIQQTNILGTRTNNPVEGALERTSVTNVRMNELGTGATPTSVAVTQAASAMGLLRMLQSDTKGVAYFKAIMSGTVTGFYLNFGKMALDGSVTPLFSSGNLVGNLTTSWAWITYTFPGASQITHTASEVIVVEYQVVGSGTVNVQGVSQPHQSDHPAATTKRTAATRNNGASGPTSLSIAAGSVGWSGNTPKVDLGRADVPAGFIPPELNFYTTNGTYTRPAWMVAGDILDIFLLPAGGGGQSGGYGVSGEGGTAGTWRTQSYVIGSDPRSTGLPIIPLSTTVFTHTFGAPGTGGINPYTLDPGDNAANSTVTATGVTTLTGTGGIGGGRAGNNTSSTSGQAAGNRTLGGYTAFGGTAAGTNQDGVEPGGGGGSGYPAFGRPGAHAKVWYRARQGA